CFQRPLHAKSTVTAVGKWRVERHRKRQSKGHPRLGWIQNPIIPQTSSSKIRITFVVVLGQDRLFKLGLDGSDLLGRWILQAAQHRILADAPQYPGRRLATHNADTAIGPAKQKARVVGAAAHAVVAGPVADPVEEGNAG